METRCDERFTPLLWLAKYHPGWTKAFKSLVVFGADVMAVDGTSDRNSVMHWLVTHDTESIVPLRIVKNEVDSSGRVNEALARKNAAGWQVVKFYKREYPTNTSGIIVIKMAQNVLFRRIEERVTCGQKW